MSKIKKLIFHTVREAICDFCGRGKTILTSVNENTYICEKCAKEINEHARTNARVYGAKNCKIEKGF